MVTEGPLERVAAIAGAPESLLAKQPDASPESLEVAEPLSIDWTLVIAARPAVAPTRPLAIRPSIVQPPVTPPPTAPAEAMPTAAPSPVERVAVGPAETSSDWSFVSIATVAFGLPVVVEALRQQDDAAPQEIVPEYPAPATAETTIPLSDSNLAPAARVESEPPATPVPLALVEPEPIPAPSDTPAAAEIAAPVAPMVGDGQGVAPRGPYQISDLVARIDAFNRLREETGRADDEMLAANNVAAPIAPRSGFRFETDAAGTIRWVEGVARAAVIGVSLDLASGTDAAKVDGVAAGAYRRRSAFADARLLIDGQSDAAGQWRISGVPVFDHATGRFTGYRGTARRPRADERAEPDHGDRSPAIDSLRQLVHELRTPTTAIAGFAEMIEGELLGPVPGPYRDYAETIRDQAMGLLGAIDDLDMAARIEAQALDLRPTEVPVGLLLQRIVHDLAPLATLRQASILLDIDAGDVAIKGDDRAVDRLFTRLFSALVSAGSAGETIAIRLGREGEDTVAVHIGRPRALAAYPGDALLAIDAESEAEIEGAPLLGTGFALRLARNLAVELGGSLTIGVDRLTLRLPAAFTHGVGQVSTI
ncbi:MAG: sensor histidine kinase [Sphingomonas sp.]|nr:sensor histidine kinase [Sphingomonas sp.]